MAEEEKNQPPSARKLAKAREEGNVAKSAEVVGFLGFLAGITGIFLLFPFWMHKVGQVYKNFVELFSTDITQKNVMAIFSSLSLDVAMILLPFFALLFVVAIFSNVAQFGFLLNFKLVLPKLSKINPISGFKNVFSLKKLLEGILITLKVFLAFGLGLTLLMYFLKQIDYVGRLDIFPQAIWVKNKALVLIFTLLVLFLIMAAIDFFIKRFQYIKSLRMSHQEIKDELKQQEGNPEVKAKIKSLMMKNSTRKMMQAIPEADVVITNPTHYAVALRFNDTDPAPIVVAKGINHLAIKIKGIAREHGVEIIQEPPLARALYSQVDIDSPIPRSMFEAVAIIFAQIRRAKESAKTF